MLQEFVFLGGAHPVEMCIWCCIDLTRPLVSADPKYLQKLPFGEAQTTGFVGHGNPQTLKTSTVRGTPTEGANSHPASVNAYHTYFMMDPSPQGPPASKGCSKFVPFGSPYSGIEGSACKYVGM